MSKEALSEESLKLFNNFLKEFGNLTEEEKEEIIAILKKSERIVKEKCRKRSS